MAGWEKDLPVDQEPTPWRQPQCAPRPSVSLVAMGRWIDHFGELIERDIELLTQMDAAIGDADHGVNMHRGMTAVAARLVRLDEDGATFDSLCREVGTTIVSIVGGAAGLLYGTFFLRFGAAAGDQTDITPERFVDALRAGLDGILARGRAQPDDKTLVDAMAPAIEAMSDSVSAGRWDLAPDAAVAAATRGCDRIVPLIARKGRASYLGPRSAGHPDPGAASTLLLFTAFRDVVAG